MLKKLVLVLLCAACLAAAVYGLLEENKRTDIINTADFYDKVYVAELTEKLAISSCQRLKTTIHEYPVILRVEPVEDLKTEYAADTIRVEVKEVFKGDVETENSVIKLVCDAWVTTTFQGADQSRGYSNVMQKGKEYLVFIKNRVESYASDIPTYMVMSSDQGMWSVCGVFCYEETKSVPYGTGKGKTTYVPYKEVKDNEFFAQTEAALDAIYELKNEVLLKYPKDSGH